MARTKHLLSLTETADRLGVHYMTAYRYVRTGRLPAAKVGQEWQVDAADVAALQRATDPQEQSTRRRRSGRSDYPRRLVDRLVQGDEAGAWALVEAALAGGMTAAQVYVDLLAPALEAIGDRWAREELDVGEEHQASVVVQRLIGRLGPSFARRGRKRGLILLGCPPGELHALPGALLRDLLRGERFDVQDLGADVPPASWARAAAAATSLVLVGIGTTTSGNERATAATIEAVRAVTDVPILVGGTGITSRAALRLGATAHSSSLAEALTRADQLVEPRVSAPA